MAIAGTVVAVPAVAREPPARVDAMPTRAARVVAIRTHVLRVVVTPPTETRTAGIRAAGVCKEEARGLTVRQIRRRQPAQRTVRLRVRLTSLPRVSVARMRRGGPAGEVEAGGGEAVNRVPGSRKVRGRVNPRASLKIQHEVRPGIQPRDRVSRRVRTRHRAMRHPLQVMARRTVKRLASGKGGVEAADAVDVVKAAIALAATISRRRPVVTSQAIAPEARSP